MSKGSSALGVLALLVGMVVGCAQAPAEHEAPRAVFLVTIDTLRADHLGCYGYPRPVTPFLDGLASQSVLFEQHIVSSSHTGPSHASLFTSLYPAQHRLFENGQKLDPANTTLAESMARAGYHTAGFPAVGFLDGLEQGFEHFDCRAGYRNAGDQLARALGWLESADPAGRVFLWIHLFDVHEWYVDANLERQALARVREDVRPTGVELEHFLADRHGLVLDGFPGKDSVVEVMDRYDAQLLSVDGALGVFFDAVGEMGWHERSLWVVTSDHGEGLGNHGFLGHGKNLYGEQIRAPLLVHAADGRYPPGRVRELVRQVDVAPTLAEVCGAELAVEPIAPQGVSLLRALYDPGVGLRLGQAFIQRRPVDEKRLREGWAPGEMFAIQTAQEKLILLSDGPCERYDLVSDPFEKHDTLARPCTEQPFVAAFFELFEAYQAEGEALKGSVIDPDHVEELKALGYL